MAEIVSGKVVSAKVREDITKEVELFKSAHGCAPGLAVIMVGDNPASAVYVRNKHKACLEVGMTSYEIKFDADISEEELLRDHSGIPHGGVVLRSGKTGLHGEHRHVIEYKLTLDSNPEFTSSVLLAYARAAFRMQQKGDSGCKTVLDVPPALLSAKSAEELRRTLL